MIAWAYDHQQTATNRVPSDLFLVRPNLALLFFGVYVVCMYRGYFLGMFRFARGSGWYTTGRSTISPWYCGTYYQVQVYCSVCVLF